MKRNLLRLGFLSLFCVLTTMVSAATDATITWAWDDATATDSTALAAQTATVSSDLISDCTVTLGESLGWYSKGISSWEDWTLENGERQYFTEFQNDGEKISSGSDASTITLSFTVASGYKFIPTNVSMKAERHGTGGGNFNLVWNKTNTITTGELGNREGTDTSWSDFSFDVSDVDAATGTCTLQIVITNLDNGKSIGFADLVISGTLAGEDEVVEEDETGEKCLYSTDFTDWTESSTDTNVSVITNYTNESLSFSLVSTSVMPEDVSNTEKFGDYEGCLEINNAKDGEGCVTTSALNSITKVQVVYGTTGSNRGLDVYAQGAGENEWVQVLSGLKSSNGSYTETIQVDRENCQLKFVSADDDNFVFLLSLKIYGNVDSDTNGINGVTLQTTGNNIYYNLNGQRVSTPTKGVYILNGKKVLVK